MPIHQGAYDSRNTQEGGALTVEFTASSPVAMAVPTRLSE
ncbi:hypothetical protein W823_11445 [Williamsia sp. D3]|nr:hypothetical protein W823_11445 [Williamsia sp. D3]